jgi:hypothetical protein
MSVDEFWESENDRSLEVAPGRRTPKAGGQKRLAGSRRTM